MLNHKSQLMRRGVDVLPRDIDIFFNDNAVCPLRFTLPSEQEIGEFKKGHRVQISICEIADNDPLGVFQSLSSEYMLLSEKYEKFSESSTYLTRLSNMSELLGNLEESKDYIKKAIEMDEDPFLKNELGDILLKQGHKKDAERLFLSNEIDTDLYSNLRLAFLATSENDIDSAEKYVKNALIIDPLSYKARMFHGAIELWLGNWEYAIRSFRVAEKRNIKSSPLYVNMAVAYSRLGYEKKAILALKKAVSINPLNENALAFLADLMFLAGRGEDAIYYLEKYVKYEQKSGEIWGRVARAYYLAGEKNTKGNRFHNQAIEALKHQSNIQESSSIWNNIAVVYWALEQRGKAQRFFSQALTKSLDLGEDSSLALCNLVGVLIDGKKYQEAFNLINVYFNQNPSNEIDDGVSARIKLQNIICLEALGKRKEASKKIQKIVEHNKIEPSMRVDMLNHLVYYYSVIEPNADILEKYIPIVLEDVSQTKDMSEQLIGRALNNIIFAYILFDKIDVASNFLGKLSRFVHKDPYSTATLGLYNLKKGNFKKGKELYEEAIKLVVDEKLKSQFKQRMYFELGKASWNGSNDNTIKRYFDKAIKQKYGFDYVNKQIKLFLQEK